MVPDASLLERLRAAVGDRYAVEREIGSGGMATVFLAEDLRHKRRVALKVLRAELAAVLGTERFLQEISVTATLQHPHILPLFDSGEAYGPDKSGPFLYYVMPYVEGESLRDRLNREKQLPIDEAIAIVADVAGALDYAHRHDVIHRDIKPANILLHEGRPLVADFGIALAVKAAGGNRLTETGLSLGTPHYMSPEQAAGDREADPRSDIYSLAVVLYELLAGDPPHTASTVQAVVAKVLTERPADVTQARSNVPAHVASALDRALEKLPADRYQTAAQFAEAISRAPSGAVARPAPAPAPAVATRPAKLLGGMGVAALALASFAAGAVAMNVLRSPEMTDGRTVRFHRVPGIPLYSDPSGILAVSPDGSRVAYIGIGEEGNQLFIHDLDQLEAHVMPGTGGAEDPTFSPDGEWISFMDGARLKKVQVSGGSPVTVADLEGQYRGATWGDDGRIIVAPSETGGLLSVSAISGERDTVVWPSEEAGYFAYRWPEALPDGRGILFTDGVTVADMRIMAYDARSGEIAPVADGVRPRYATSGHLLYVTPSGALMAAPFDLDRLEVTGSAFSVAGRILVKGSGGAEYDVGDDGSLAYVRAGSDLSQLVLVDRGGVERPLLEEPRNYAGVAFSPDGDKLAISIFHEASTDIWMYDMTVSTMSRRTFGGENVYPTWTADSRSILFSSDQSGRGRGIWLVSADGSDSPAPVFAIEARHAVYEGHWSPGGDWFVYRQTRDSTGRDILRIPTQGDSTVVELVATAASERAFTISPDGRWLAYVSDETGQSEVYVRQFVEGGGRWLVSTAGGTEPQWSRDGRELFYRTATDFVAARVEGDPVFRVLDRQILFTDDYLRQVQNRRYDVHPGGRGFVMVKSTASAEIVTVLNWGAEHR